MTIEVRRYELIRAHLARVNPEAIVKVDLHIVVGDSIAGATGGDTEPVERSVNNGVAWVCDHRIVAPARLSNLAKPVGDYSPYPIMAERIFETTGRRSIWIMLSKGLTGLCRTSSPDRHWDMASPDCPGNLLTRPNPKLGSSSTLDYLTQFLRASPGFDIQDTFVHAAFGKTDAVAFRRGTTTGQEFGRAMTDLWQYFSKTCDAKHLFTWTIGRRGNTADRVAELMASADFDAVRAAHWAVAGASDCIHVVYDHAHELGEPPNTLETDERGFWVSGHENSSDESHYSQASYDCIAETAGRNIAKIIGPQSVAT